jgi:threonine synthase
MHYFSTRGQAPIRDFAGVLLAGLAEDGGLYMPVTWPHFAPPDWRAMRGLPYPALAARVMQPFVGEAIPFAMLEALCHDTYAGFGHPAVVPLVQLETGLFVQELFHGPTLAFKDMALQLLGRLFDHVLTARDQRVTIVGATSGDTGSAALAACAGRARIDIVILHPEGRTSEVQRRQMTTVQDANVSNIAIQGNFDDCQDLVKAMFADTGFRAAHNLSAVNSINWARIAAQTVYYVVAALALGAPDRTVNFAVPTGNFGNVYAGHVARLMGLPIARLVIATNRNDILARFFNDGAMALRAVEPSLSPSMDIQVSSNFERLLFDLRRRNGRAVAEAMSHFRAVGTLPVTPAEAAVARQLFMAYGVDDDATLAEITRTWRDSGTLIDPHTAVGMAAARAHQATGRDPGVPTIVLATAHPAKFPEAIERATGIRPALPHRLADLMERPERLERLPNDVKMVEDFVRGHARPRRGVAA